jgi:uncharacterized protein YjhX (UPF0386 family)
MFHPPSFDVSGDFIAVSTASGIRVYELCASGKDHNLYDVDSPIVLKRAQLPDILGDGEFAHHMVFTTSTTAGEAAPVPASERKRSNSKTTAPAKKAATTIIAVHCARRGAIVLCECVRGTAEAPASLKVLQSIKHRNIIQSRTGSMERVSDLGLTQAVNKIVFSGDGKYLAVSSCSSKSIVYIYDLSGYVLQSYSQAPFISLIMLPYSSPIWQAKAALDPPSL